MNKTLEDAKQKEIEELAKIDEEITQTEQERDALDTELNLDDSIEKYSGVLKKKNDYDAHIKELKEERLAVKSNVYTSDVIEQAKTEIQEEYNEKLNTVYDALMSACQTVIDAYDDYNAEYNNFLEERNAFDLVADEEKLDINYSDINVVASPTELFKRLIEGWENGVTTLSMAEIMNSDLYK